MKKILTCLAAFTIATPAMAAFSVSDLHSASTLSVTDFGKTNPDHSAHLTGYKTWKSGDDAKVKVYVAHDGMNMEFNYVCHKHTPTTVECHFQP